MLRGLAIFVVILSIGIYVGQRRWSDRNGGDGPVVELPFQGKISGTKILSRFAEREILAFKGIPYARKVATLINNNTRGNTQWSILVRFVIFVLGRVAIDRVLCYYVPSGEVFKGDSYPLS